MSQQGSAIRVLLRYRTLVSSCLQVENSRVFGGLGAMIDIVSRFLIEKRPGQSRDRTGRFHFGAGPGRVSLEVFLK